MEETTAVFQNSRDVFGGGKGEDRNQSLSVTD
jgi:hypothetical protein